MFPEYTADEVGISGIILPDWIMACNAPDASGVLDCTTVKECTFEGKIAPVVSLR